jgi:pimeloyl-ACP methyl ester carboxylesterase
MSAGAGSPISTYFRVCDGVRVRFADNRADSDTTVLLLAPWPESLWAFRRIWDRVSAVGRVVAIDLPGFGHSDGRPDLIAPDASGAFLGRLIDEWGLGAPTSSARTSARPRRSSLPRSRQSASRA